MLLSKVSWGSWFRSTQLIKNSYWRPEETQSRISRPILSANHLETISPHSQTFPCGCYCEHSSELDLEEHMEYHRREFRYCSEGDWEMSTHTADNIGIPCLPPPPPPPPPPFPNSAPDEGISRHGCAMSRSDQSESYRKKAAFGKGMALATGIK